MTQIDTTSTINAVRLVQQGSNPSSPAASHWLMFIKSDGLYIKDSAGNVTGPFGTGAGVAADAIWDAKGDLAIGTGSNTAARLAVGTNDYVLTAASGETTGVKWAAVSASGGRTLIGTEQTPTGTGTVTWSDIPGTYKSLEIEFVARGTRGADRVNIATTFNADTNNDNYHRGGVYQDKTATTSHNNYPNRFAYWIDAGNSGSGSCAHGWVKIINYASTTFRKRMVGQVACNHDQGDFQECYFGFTMEWSNTAAITTITLGCEHDNYDTGSTFRLYGLS